MEICKERNGVRDLDSSAFPTFNKYLYNVLSLAQQKFFVLNHLYLVQHILCMQKYGTLCMARNLEDYIMKIKNQDKMYHELDHEGLCT